MKKSVYSLVLSDQVVEAVDRAAYLNNTSRSALINQILADYVSYITPEKRMETIFSELTKWISGSEFQVQTQPSDAMISIRSPLRYKYKPTIKYAVELYRETGKVVGELRVMFRTQSQSLIGDLTRFFLYWAKLEHKYLSRLYPENQVKYTIEDGRFLRTLTVCPDKEHVTDEQIGEAIANYIQVFDRVLKLYFAQIDQPAQAAEEMEKEYVGYLKNGVSIL